MTKKGVYPGVRRRRRNLPPLRRARPRAVLSRRRHNSFSCMFVRPLRVGTNNVSCSCFSARQYPRYGPSRVLLSEKGTWGGAAGGVERTRSASSRGCAARSPSPPAASARVSSTKRTDHVRCAAWPPRARWGVVCRPRLARDRRVQAAGSVGSASSLASYRRSP
jgi:hypothetical protein